jgi:hypothetical protein
MIAFNRMRAADVAQLPVLSNGQLVGIIDESDLLLSVGTQPERFNNPVGATMTRRLEILALLRPAALRAALDRGLTAVVADDVLRPDHPLRPAQPSAKDAILNPSDTSKIRTATRVIHAGQSPDPSTGAIMPPIYATSTFVQDSPACTRAGLRPLAQSHALGAGALRGRPGKRRARFAFASGLAAISTVLELADAGSHIIAGDDMYGGTYRLFERVRRRSAGHDFTYVDLTSPENLLAAIKPETKMVWVETPTNPMLKLADLQAIAQICRERGIIAVADNTFASPMVQRPLEHGFDIVVHSATKYLNGHSDIIGGIAVVGGEPHQKAWREQLAFLQNSVGAMPARSTASSPCAA